MMQTISQTINLQTLQQDSSVLQALGDARAALAELKGIAHSVPNQAILVDTLSLQEAQDSSSIENIITTQDEIFKHFLNQSVKNLAAKEVANYAEALYFLYQQQQEKGFISINMLVEAQNIIQKNNAGIRQQMGTTLKNEQTQAIIYTPPSPLELDSLLKDLEQFINNNDDDLHPLIKMAIIHHQFESIHPFYDGNGRIGRILNIIYLIQAGLLDTPILYLSRYINHNKPQYYALLQSVRASNHWQVWIIYIMNGVAKTAQSTIEMVKKIRNLQQKHKHLIREKCPKIYSQDLLNNIFKHPYAKVSFVQNGLGVSRPTARRYLQQLVDISLLKKKKLGRTNYYFNPALIRVLTKTDNLQNTE